MSTWPNHFPSDCPPDTAADATGVYYRLSKTVPVTGDFLQTPYDHMGAKRDSCEGRALSVFDEVKHAVEMYKLRPTIGRHVMKVELRTSCGVIDLEPNSSTNSHRNWWIDLGITLASFTTTLELEAV